jgi:hypothetical protein
VFDSARFDLRPCTGFEADRFVRRITALEPERRFAYEGTENPQLTGYRAAVELTALPPLHAGHGDRAGRSRRRLIILSTVDRGGPRNLSS